MTSFQPFKCINNYHESYFELCIFFHNCFNYSSFDVKRSNGKKDNCFAHHVFIELANE